MNRRTVPNHDNLQFRHISEVLPAVLAKYTAGERSAKSRKRTNQQMTLFDDLVLSVARAERQTVTHV